MIVDDDPSIHVSLIGLLSDPQLEIFSVYNPIEGFQWLEKSSVDLIICDVGLPKMNGLEFVRQLRKKNKMMCVLFFTGVATQVDRAVMKELKVDSVINKGSYDVFHFKTLVHDLIFNYQDAL